MMNGAFSIRSPLTVALLLQPEVAISPGAVGGPGAAVSTLSVPPGRPKVGEPQIEYWSCVYIGPLILSPVIQLITPQSRRAAVAQERGAVLVVGRVGVGVRVERLVDRVPEEVERRVAAEAGDDRPGRLVAPVASAPCPVNFIRKLPVAKSIIVPTGFVVLHAPAPFAGTAT